MGSEQRLTGPKILQLDVVILEIFQNVPLFPTSDFIFAIETYILDTLSGRIQWNRRYKKAKIQV